MKAIIKLANWNVKSLDRIVPHKKDGEVLIKAGCLHAILILWVLKRHKFNKLSNQICILLAKTFIPNQ